MNRKQIEAYLAALQKTRRRLHAEELERLYELASIPDAVIRSDVAALLIDHYEEKSEEVLLRLTYDSDAGVRADAVDSLCIARKEQTLERLLQLAGQDREYTVRGFAVHSTYDVFVNMFGDSDNTHKTIANVLTPMLEREPNDWVRTCYYCVLYLSGQHQYLQALLDAFEDGDQYIRGSVLEAFEDILSEENAAAIEEALQYAQSFEDQPHLMEKMEQLLLFIEEDRNGAAW